MACILTLPQYQRKGYGKLLIEFSKWPPITVKVKLSNMLPIFDNSFHILLNLFQVSCLKLCMCGASWHGSLTVFSWQFTKVCPLVIKVAVGLCCRLWVIQVWRQDRNTRETFIGPWLAVVPQLLVPNYLRNPGQSQVGRWKPPYNIYQVRILYKLCHFLRGRGVRMLSSTRKFYSQHMRWNN